MVITARFGSECPRCSKGIRIGESVEWVKGSKAYHVDCSAIPERTTESTRSQQERHGRRFNRYGSTYTRFSSGAEVFTNKRGRCEDAPCCGCCS